MLGAQPLDGAGQRELGAAEALDEVAAARDAERLQPAQLGVERGEATGHAFGEDELAGEDPVALEQQLGQRARRSECRRPARREPARPPARLRPRPWTG